MNIGCMLALTACLQSQGVLLSGSDAVELLDDCEVISQMSLDEYEGGLATGYWEIFSAKGLYIPPGKTALQRKQNALNVCKHLERDFYSDGAWVPRSTRNLLWWVNIFGITLEIVGAALIVSTGLRNTQRIKFLRNTWDGGSFEHLRDAVAGQAITELRGFFLVGIGLVLQLLGVFYA